MFSPEAYALAEGLVSKAYINQGSQATARRSKLVTSLREVVANTVKDEQAKLEAMRTQMPELRVELEELREMLGGDVRAVA